MWNSNLARSAALAALGLGLAAGCQGDRAPAPKAGPAPKAASAPAATQVQIGGVHWYVDYGAAQAAARAQDKALWVHFGENPG